MWQHADDERNASWTLVASRSHSTIELLAARQARRFSADTLTPVRYGTSYAHEHKHFSFHSMRHRGVREAARAANLAFRPLAL
jgi:hypothetical protein